MKIILDSLIDLTIHHNHLVRKCQDLRGLACQRPVTEPHEPVHLRCFNLNLIKHEKQRKEDLCFNVALANHLVDKWPNHLKKPTLTMQAERTPTPLHNPLLSLSQLFSYQCSRRNDFLTNVLHCNLQ